MDIVLRHILRRVTEHGADCQFRKAEFARDASECMPKGVWRDARNPCKLANTVQAGTDSSIWSGTGFRCEDIRIAEYFWLAQDDLQGRRANGTDLRTAFGVWETDEASRSVNPGPLHGLGFFPAITG